MSGDVTLGSDGFTKLEEDYEADILISYLDFCKLNIVSDPNDSMIEKWVNQTCDSYQKDLPPQLIMDNFNIPRNKVNIISNRHYQISVKNISNDKENKVVKLRLNLHTMPTSLLE